MAFKPRPIWPNIFEKGLVNDSLLYIYIYVVATLAVASVGKKTRWGKWKGERKGTLQKGDIKEDSVFCLLADAFL